MFDFFHKRPYLLYSIILGMFVMGLYGLITMPKNLFPDSDRPTVIVITRVPGATPNVVATSVSKPIEEELATLSLIRRVSSTNIAGRSIVTAEFKYKKGLNAAAVDVNNAINKVKGELPRNVNPTIYTSGSFTLPTDVFALSPKNENLSLDSLRKLVNSDIKPALLRNREIGNVEVFGGYASAINIYVDPIKAKSYGIQLVSLINKIRSLDKDTPIGISKGNNSFYTIAYYGEKDSVQELESLPIAPNVHLSDIAKVEWSHDRRLSGYIGNGRRSIAIAVQRAPGGSVLSTSEAARYEIAKLKQRYPNIRFELANTQKNLIETSNDNMLGALRDAIIFTLIVILLFLGNLRAVFAALLSVPMVFFGTIAVIWLTGGELNIVIYTAIILALGMLVDDAVVVLENIERHINEINENLENAIINGTKEVIAPVFAGTVATSAVMFPLMFSGGFPQQIYRPLISTLIIALLVSYFLSITFIPSISVVLYKKGAGKTKFEKTLEKFYKNTFGKLKLQYISILKFSHKSALRRIVMTLAVFLVLIFSVKAVTPIIGQDLMPPMDTGIIKGFVKFSANETVNEEEQRLKPFLKWLHKQPEVVMSSVSFGSEPGVLSLGAGALPTEAKMTISCVNRFERKKSIWELEDEIRNKLAELQNVKNVDVYDFGATPMSSIKAPVVSRLKAEDYHILPKMAHKVQKAMYKIKGFTSVDMSWDNDFTEARLDLNPNKLLMYNITPSQAVAQLPLSGMAVTLSGNLVSLQVQPVRVYFNKKFEGNLENLRLIPIQTPKGPVPLEALGTINYGFTANKIERDQMLYSLDVSGYRRKKPISKLTEETIISIKKAGIKGVTISQEGDIAQMKDSSKRMFRSIGIGIVLLLMALIAIYKSVRMSIVMVLVLPFSIIGASWGMLFFNKPNCMPSLVGIMLLFGIIIKNSVLLIDFYQGYRKKEEPFEAAIESVRVRFRPVFMTAFGTIAGMIPLSLEWAVGLERLSPLADVAVGGLLIGTILTLIYIPMFAYWVDKKETKKAYNAK